MVIIYPLVKLGLTDVKQHMGRGGAMALPLPLAPTVLSESVRWNQSARGNA